MRSMTGFGRGEAVAESGTAFVVEVRSGNHRFLDVVVRVPREYGEWERRLREMAARHLARGRCELVMAVTSAAPGGRRLFVDSELAVAYHQALQALAERLGLPAAARADAVLGMPGVCALLPGPAAVDGDWPAAASAAAAALHEMEASCAAEGLALQAALADILGRMQGVARDAQERAPTVAAEQWSRLCERLRQLVAGDTPGAVDDRARAELAVILQRVDCGEELVRIASHIAQFREAIERGGAAGRRCDFLAQELHREWNTLASKAGDSALADLAIEARVLVEQLREQAANLQ